jgi:hypothetical protein
MGLHDLLRGCPYNFYVDDVRTLQETQASTACYGDNFAFYMQLMFIPHTKHRWAATACYEDSFTFYMCMMFVPRRKQISTDCCRGKFTFRM